jgi:hypothetical protein
MAIEKKRRMNCDEERKEERKKEKKIKDRKRK